MIKKALREIKNQTFPEIQRKVRDATSSEPYMAPRSLLEEIADATHSPFDYDKIREILWNRINDRAIMVHAYKGLLLLNFLLENGAPRVKEDVLLHRIDFIRLKTQRFWDNGIENGSRVRELGEQIANQVFGEDLEQRRGSSSSQLSARRPSAEKKEWAQLELPKEAKATSSSSSSSSASGTSSAAAAKKPSTSSAARKSPRPPSDDESSPPARPVSSSSNNNNNNTAAPRLAAPSGQNLRRPSRQLKSSDTDLLDLSSAAPEPTQAFDPLAQPGRPDDVQPNGSQDLFGNSTVDPLTRDSWMASFAASQNNQQHDQSNLFGEDLFSQSVNNRNEDRDWASFEGEQDAGEQGPSDVWQAGQGLVNLDNIRQTKGQQQQLQQKKTSGLAMNSMASAKPKRGSTGLESTFPAAAPAPYPGAMGPMNPMGGGMHPMNPMGGMGGMGGMGMGGMGGPMNPMGGPMNPMGGIGPMNPMGGPMNPMGGMGPMNPMGGMGMGMGMGAAPMNPMGMPGPAPNQQPNNPFGPSNNANSANKNDLIFF